ncbi:MAG: glycosyltransferase family 9 protein [Candidatus Delongbacteria bacterium]|nr:glycosyltransferase family 9 protein [Candidatus Delongbacteria bacterium]
MKILILRFSSLGDILLATPVLDVLKEKYPESEIDWVVNSKFAEVLITNPRLNRVLTFKDKTGLENIRRDINRTNYDLIFDLHQNSSTHYLTRFQRNLYRYNKHVVDRSLLVFLKKKYKEIIPVTQMYFKALNKAGIVTPKEWTLRYGLVKSFQLSTINEYNLHNFNYIAIAPGASYATKIWPKEYFKELVEKISFNKNINRKVILVGNSEADKIAADHITKGNEFSCINLVGKLDLQETATILKYSDLVISNDSGPLHLAECFKKKIIAIFGCTTEELGFFPYSTDYVVVENKGLKCRPCTHFGKKQCPKKHFKCMIDISVDDVYREILNFLR